MKKQLKFTQIISAAWKGADGLTYSIYGLSTDGKVYQHTTRGWKPMVMSVREEVDPTLNAEGDAK